MRGKQAKILSDDNFDDLLLFAETSRHPLRNKIIVLLSAKAGLRAGEIARLTWAMVTDPAGGIGTVLELPDWAAKKRSGRVIPLHEDLQTALAAWRPVTQSAGPVIVSERGGPMTPQGIVVWFANAYRLVGRRLFVAFRAPHIYYPCCAARAQSWWVVTRRAAAGRPSVNPNHPAVHRRGHRCSAQARVADLRQRHRLKFCRGLLF
jgi:integrase